MLCDDNLLPALFTALTFRAACSDSNLHAFKLEGSKGNCTWRYPHTKAPAVNMIPKV